MISYTDGTDHSSVIALLSGDKNFLFEITLSTTIYSWTINFRRTTPGGTTTAHKRLTPYKSKDEEFKTEDIIRIGRPDGLVIMTIELRGSFVNK